MRQVTTPLTLEAAAPTGREDIDALGPWFHNLHLRDGAQTAPNHRLGDFPKFKWDEIECALPEDLSGWRALDIGCNAGFYSFELANRGADVLGIDPDEHYLRQARWAREQLQMEDRVRFQRLGVYDLARLDETFDLVWFMGVFYHLRYPLLGLDLAALATDRMLVFQTLTRPGIEVMPEVEDVEFEDRAIMRQPGWPTMAFIEHRLAGDPTNWWAPDHAAVEAMLRSCGMRVVSRPTHEVYIAVPDPDNESKRADTRDCVRSVFTGIA